MSSTWYHRRWGYFSNAKGRKPKIAVAGRRLKHSCTFCKKPILKGEEYRISYYKPDFYQPSIVDFYAHEKCYETDCLERQLDSLRKSPLDKSYLDTEIKKVQEELEKLRGVI